MTNPVLTEDEFTGTCGTAWRIPLIVPDENPNFATLDLWLLKCPGAHPWWDNYVLFVVHLRDIEGQTRAPLKEYHNATHEILLGAVDPDTFADAALVTPATVARALHDSTQGWILEPLNYVHQICEATDDQARLLVRLLARAVVDGYLLPEPEGIIGARQQWGRAIVSTIEHIQQGGHPNG